MKTHRDKTGILWTTDEKTGKIYAGEPQIIPITTQQIRRGFAILNYQGRVEQHTEALSRDWFENCYKRPLTNQEAALHLVYYEQAHNEYFKPEKEEDE